MKIAPKTNYDAVTCKNNLNSNTVKRNPSFGSTGSGIKDFLKTGATETFKFIDRNGFFVEFLIVDTVSMVIPRIWIGLGRDKDKTGKTNYQAGAEEAGREILSGPSMNLIPMGLLALVTKYNPASHIGKGSLEALTSKMKQVVEQAPDLKEKSSLHKMLADKIFDDAFGEFELENKTELQGKFSELLTESTTLKPKSMLAKIGGKFSGNENDPFKKAIEAFEEHVALINNQNKKVKPLDTKGITLHTDVDEVINGVKSKVATSGSAKDLFEDFHSYSKDILEKFTKTTQKEAADSLGKLTKQRLNLKLATAVTAFIAVGSFLLYLPKIYQQGSISPAAASAERAKAAAKEGCSEGGANNEN